MKKTAIKKRRKNALHRLTPAGKLLEMIAMRHIPQALHVVAILGIADLLADGPKSSDELAQITGSHARTLHRVLKTLVAAGVFAEDKAGCFCLTALSQPLRTDAPDSVRAASIFLSGESELEGFLVDCVRTGKTAIELAGDEVDDRQDAVDRQPRGRWRVHRPSAFTRHLDRHFDVPQNSLHLGQEIIRGRLI